MKLYSPSQVRKALGTAIVGVYAWAGFVVNSPQANITANEWLLLGGVAVAVAAAFGLTNAAIPVAVPEPTPVPELVSPLAVEVASPNAKFVGAADQVVPPAA